MRDLSPTLLRFAAMAARLASWPARVVAARAALAELARLDARELADIGLTSADLRDATALARDHDPTTFLAERAGAKRAAAARREPPPRPKRMPRLRLAKTGS